MRGRRLLAEADVVVADRLAPRPLLDELHPDVELVDAAKLPRGRAAQQEEINRILVERAQQGKVVVRLKGGDPYVFGRGFEEALACAEAGVPWTVVPGVTQRDLGAGGGRDPGDPPRGGARVHRRVRAHPAGAPGLAGELGGAGPAARDAGAADGGREPARYRRPLIATAVAPATPAGGDRRRHPSGAAAGDLGPGRDRRRRWRTQGVGAPAIVVIGNVVDVAGQA